MAEITTGKKRSELEFESDNDEATCRIDDRLISVQYISVEIDDDKESSQPANDIFFNNVVNSADMLHRNRDHLHLRPVPAPMMSNY